MVYWAKIKTCRSLGSWYGIMKSPWAVETDGPILESTLLSGWLWVGCNLIISFHRRDSGLRLGCGEDFAWCIARYLASYRWKKRSWRVSSFCNLRTLEVKAWCREQLWHTLACSTLLSFQVRCMPHASRPRVQKYVASAFNKPRATCKQSPSDTDGQLYHSGLHLRKWA